MSLRCFEVSYLSLHLLKPRPSVHLFQSLQMDTVEWQAAHFTESETLYTFRWFSVYSHTTHILARLHLLEGLFIVINLPLLEEGMASPSVRLHGQRLNISVVVLHL
jgi:hypothetical protein